MSHWCYTVDRPPNNATHLPLGSCPLRRHRRQRGNRLVKQKDRSQQRKWASQLPQSQSQGLRPEGGNAMAPKLPFPA